MLVADTKEDGVTERRELAGDFEADPFVGSSDEGDFLVHKKWMTGPMVLMD